MITIGSVLIQEPVPHRVSMKVLDDDNAALFQAWLQFRQQLTKRLIRKDNQVPLVCSKIKISVALYDCVEPYAQLFSPFLGLYQSNISYIESGNVPSVRSEIESISA